jgi:hypothetical protein
MQGLVREQNRPTALSGSDIFVLRATLPQAASATLAKAAVMPSLEAAEAKSSEFSQSMGYAESS